MDLEKNKIPSPFRAPEGYFDDFEARLTEKMGKKPEKSLKVSRGGLAPMEYAAIAATLAAILLTSWFVFMKPGMKDEPVIATVPVIVEKPDTATVVVNIPDPELVENSLVEAIIEEPVDANPVGVSGETASLSKAEMKIAQQLEDAGLIVLDANDGLFDSFEL